MKKPSRFFFPMFFLIITCSYCSVWANEQWTIISKYDSFKIKRKQQKYFIGSSVVNIDLIQKLMPFFSTKLEDSCPSQMGKPDVTIEFFQDNEKIKRTFFFNNRIINEGKKCGEIVGDGIYYVPLHRSWFLGSKEESVKIGSTIKIEKEGLLFAEFEKKTQDWKNKDAAFFTNWIFFQQFIDALQRHTVSARLHLLAAANKPSFQVTTANLTYHFYKIDDNQWTLKRPDKEWLIASNSFHFLQDMSPSLWRDRHGQNLAILKDNSQAPDNRIKALQNLGLAWTQAIKEEFHALLLNPNEDPKLKEEITLAIRQKPSLENFGVLIKAMEQTQDISLLHQMTSVLRLRNKEGPLIQPEDDPQQVSQAVQEWSKWWKKISAQGSNE